MIQAVLIGIAVLFGMLCYLSFRLEDVLATGIHEEREWEISGDDVRKIVELVVEELEKRNNNG